MIRGKSQVLFKYLPGKPIDADGHGLGIVTNWSSTPVEGINETRIVKEIYSTFARFRNPEPSGFPPIPDLTRFKFLSPKRIEYELFPLTFICSNPVCNKAVTFTGAAQYNSMLRNGMCPRCKQGRMLQIDLVHVEKGGRIGFPRISPCEKHKYEYMKLEKFGFDNPGEWKFICGICGQPGKGGGSLNSSSKFLGAKTSEKNSILYPVPVRKGQVYIPQSTMLVNLQNLNEKLLYEDVSFQKKIIADYLGLFQEKGLKFEDFIEIKDELMRKKLEVIENLKGKVPENYLEEMRKELDSTLPDNLRLGNEIVKKVEDSIDLGKISLLKVASSLYEYMEMLKKSGALSLSKIIQIAEQENNPNLENIKDFPKRMRAIKVTNSYVLNDLSLVQAVYGYTRDSFVASETDLCSFPQDMNYADFIPIYVNIVNSEAIVLEFDRLEIIKWLAENKVISSEGLPTNEKDARVWFLNNINLDKVNRFEEIEGEGTTKWVYRLLHSACHTLLLNSTVLCGMDKDSLSELIYPNVPAIVIYSSNVRGTQLGGMFTLFENRVYPWIDQTLKAMHTCIYDPLCSEKQGACHACMFLSEFSCCHFNNDLSRWYLVGKKGKIKGFWQDAKL